MLMTRATLQFAKQPFYEGYKREEEEGQTFSRASQRLKFSNTSSFEDVLFGRRGNASMTSQQTRVRPQPLSRYAIMYQLTSENAETGKGRSK